MVEKRKKILVCLAAAVGTVVFFAAYSFLPLTAPARFNSPDENANSFFTRIFAAESRLWSFEMLNVTVPGLVHPRSVRVVEDILLVPGGFIGLPVLYGAVAKIFGLAVVPFLTALFAVLAAWAWAALVGRFFGRGIGALSGLLLLANPVWWYESSRPFMPNILFTALSIFAAWFLLAAPLLAARAGRERKKWDVVWRADGILAGLAFGLALAVRPSEAYWLVLAAIVLAAAAWKKLPWSRLVLFALFAAAVLLPFLNLNHSIYGQWLGTGYGQSLGEQVMAGLPAGGGAKLLGGLQPYLFPLGFAPRTAWHNFCVYGVKFFWFWSVLVGLAAVAALFVAWRRRRSGLPVSRPALVFAAVFAAVSVWLILFYGSWNIQDNPDPAAVTIGTSYFRYWLPIFVLSVVPVAWFLSAVSRRLTPRFRPAILAAFILVFTAVSGYAVFAAPQEGLLTLRANLRLYDSEVRQILAATEPNALVVVDRADKLLFPERAVIYPLRREETYAALKKLAGNVPLYYFGITFPERDLEWLRHEKLPPLGLTIEPVVSFSDETLYAFRLLPPS